MSEEIHFAIFQAGPAKVLPQVSVPFPPVTSTHPCLSRDSTRHLPTQFNMAGNEDPFSSPLFVPQDSPELGVGANIGHSDLPFEELDLGVPLEAPDVDMDRVDDSEDFGNPEPEPEPVKAGRSIFRLPEAGNTFLVGTQQSTSQASIPVEQSEGVEVRVESSIGRDVSFTSPTTLSPRAAFDFDLGLDADADADVFSFGETHTNTEVGTPGQDLPVAQLHEDLSITQPHVFREVESEVIPSFATDVGQIEFTFGQPDFQSDFAAEANQRQSIIDQNDLDAGREVRQESPFSTQYRFGSPLPSLQPIPEDQVASAPAIEREQANAATSPLNSHELFDLPSDVPSLKSEREDVPAPAPVIERGPANSVFPPPISQNQIDLPPLEPEFEEKPAFTPTIKREPPSSTISPFTSRAERARRAQLNAIKPEMSDRKAAKIGGMANPLKASAATGSGTPKKNTVTKEATLSSAAAFTQAARTRERLGTPFGIKPKEISTAVRNSESARAEIAIDNAFKKLVPRDNNAVPTAATPTYEEKPLTYEDIYKREREQKRIDKLNEQRKNKANDGNGNNGPNIPSMFLSQPTNHPSMFRPPPTNVPLVSPPNPVAPQAKIPATPESLLARAYKHLDDTAQYYRDVENGACEREEHLAELWTIARQLRVQAIEERRDALVVIRHRRRQLDALRGLSGVEIVQGGLERWFRPLHVENEPCPGSEEFEKMVVEGQEAGVEDDGYETPPSGGSD